MPSHPPARSAQLATTTLVLLAGAWWIVRPEAPATGGDAVGGSARRAVAQQAPAPGGCLPGDDTAAPADPLGWRAPGPQRLVAGAGLLPSDRVAELITDLRLLQPSSRLPGREAGVVRRLEQFVLDVHAADQADAAVAELERRLDDAPIPREAHAGEPRAAVDDWLSARLLVALAGLGATRPVLAHWPQLVPVERADVLLALGWDPLAAPDAPRLEARRADGLVRGAPLLPLVLTRPPGADTLAFLRERLDDPTDGLHGLRVRDAAVLVLAAGLGREPACLGLIEGSLRADPAGSFVALFSLAASDAPAARSLLGTLRRRHGQGHPLPTDDLAAHERFALDLGLALVAARGEELLDVSALRDGLLPGRDVATRLASASGLLARISDGLSHIDTRWTLSDALVGALANERDRDVAWLELLALRQLHIGEAWLPSRTIGYGAEDGLDPERAGRRTATFLAYLSDTNPATRRVAVFGLLGTSDTRGVEPALTAALAVEPDRRIAQWMRLALLRL
jgi:hypothetical protein